MRVMYICDGMRSGCKKTICAYLGRGRCKHTTSEIHAKYGKAEQITEDRFVITNDMAIEKEKAEVGK